MIIDIQEIITQKIKEMDANKVIEKTIQDTLEKTVIGAIENALKGYELRNLIEKKISTEVSNVVTNIGFTAYNSFIAEKVKSITEDYCNADIAAKIEKTFQEILVVKRDSVKLSEIFEKYREWVCQSVDESDKYNLEYFHVKFEEDEKYHWFDIELAKERSKDRFSSHDELIRFTVHRKRDQPGFGFLSTVYIDGYDVKNKFSFRHMSYIELLLVNLVYNETPIEIDVESKDDIDDSYDIDR